MKEISLVDLVQRFPDQDTARIWLEAQRWGEKRVPDACPSCGVVATPTVLTTRPGVFRCRSCHEEFTVRTGTVMERSHIPLNKWIYGVYLYVSSRKGISSIHLGNLLGITQKSAWFMLQRLREASANGELGLLAGIVEADETYVGGKEADKHESDKKHDGRGPKGKTPVLGARSRDGKMVGAVSDETTMAAIQAFLIKNLDPEAILFSDEAKQYQAWQQHFNVNHSAGKYVDGMIHTNGIESMWAALKRGITGVYHSVTYKHLQRYVNEFTFRLSRCDKSLEQQMTDVFGTLAGARLQYKQVTA